jgi:hypothetical protein
MQWKKDIHFIGKLVGIGTSLYHGSLITSMVEPKVEK